MPWPRDLPAAGLARRERHDLCDTLLRLGPDQPTLCPPWTTRDLAAHLCARERQPVLEAAGMVGPFRGLRERVQSTYAARPYPALVDLLRSGPPRWMPTRIGWLDDVWNLGEMFIHHEDVLRGGRDWHVRAVDHELDDALWAMLGRLGQLAVRRATVGVVIAAPHHGRRRLKRPTALGSVTVTGTPGELTLFTSGRHNASHVEVAGDPQAVAAFDSTALGMR